MIKANSAMAACSVGNDAVVVNGVQDQGFTPLEEFLPRSAPKTVLTTALQLCQSPHITRQTLSALKSQIRSEQVRARELRTMAVEKEEDLKGLNVKQCA